MQMQVKIIEVQKEITHWSRRLSTQTFLIVHT